MAKKIDGKLKIGIFALVMIVALTMLGVFENYRSGDGLVFKTACAGDECEIGAADDGCGPCKKCKDQYPDKPFVVPGCSKICTSGEECIDDLCCPEDRACGDECCHPDMPCIDNRCCPAYSVCGDECCQYLCCDDECCIREATCCDGCCFGACYDGNCAPYCIDSSDCSAGTFCTGGECHPPPAPGPPSHHGPPLTHGSASCGIPSGPGVGPKGPTVSGT